MIPEEKTCDMAEDLVEDDFPELTIDSLKGFSRKAKIDLVHGGTFQFHKN